MRRNFLNKFFVFIASLSLLFNSLVAPLSVAYAQEETQTPEPILVFEEMVVSESSVEISDPVWKDNSDGSVTTSNPVGEGISYQYKDSQVKVIFTKVTSLGDLTIKEVSLSESEVEELGALSNTAYDISSSMEDGTFEYNLTLPNPDITKDVQVKYSEDGENYQEIESEAQENVLLIKGLNHFTVFVMVSNSTPPPISYQEGVIDNGDVEYSEIGSWSDAGACAPNAYGGDGRWSDSTGVKTATWQINVPQTGHYKVYFSWVKHTNRALNASYAINYEGGSTVSSIDQTGTVCEWSDFVLQGTYLFNYGTTYSVVLSNEGIAADQYVFADAIKIEGGDDITPAVPTNLYPSDDLYLKTSTLTNIDWSDVGDDSSPVTYLYQSSYSSSTNPDRSFSSPVYTSTALSLSQIPAGGTPAGVYYWHVKSQDSLGNQSAWSTPWKITVDNTSPVIALHEDMIVEADSSSGKTVTYTSPSVTDNVDIDFTATCLPASGSVFSFGSTTVNCDATDRAGNNASQTSFLVSVVDTTAPVAPIVSSSSHTLLAWSIDRTIDVSWIATDFSGISDYSYSWDYNPVTTPDNVGEGIAVSVTSPNRITSQSVYFHIKAIDGAGNWSETTHLGPFWIDYNNPTVTWLNLLDGSFVRGVLSLEANASDIGSGIDFLRFRYMPVGSSFVTLLEDNSGSPYEASWDTTGLNGDYILRARAFDVSGRSSSVASSDIDVTVDNTGPTGSITSPSSGAYLSGTVEIMVNTDDGIGSGIERVEFSYNGAPVPSTPIDQDTTFPYSVFWNTVGVTEGAHTIYIKIFDLAGNDSGYIGIPVVIDNTPPTVISVDSDGETYNIASVSPRTIKVTFNEDIANLPTIGVNPTSIEYQTVNECGDGDAKTFCFDYAIPVGQDFQHRIHITSAQDVAGNIMTEDLGHTFNVDTSAPLITSFETDKADGFYGIGESINFIVGFNDIVNVTGTPYILLNSGSGRSAYYMGGSGSNVLTFNYVVGTSDGTEDLVNSALSIQLDGAIMEDVNGNGVDLVLPDISIFQTAHQISIDTTSPSSPSIDSSSHVLSTWNDDRTIDISWSSSDGTGSGIRGYSWVWDTNSVTVPDQIEEPFASSATSGKRSTSQSIYFHIRAVDNVGNWSEETNYGPFWVDSVNPTVLWTNPLVGDLLRGVVSLEAQANDNLGGSGVNFVRFRWMPVGGVFTTIAEIFTGPSYQTPWDTVGLNGSYVLRARAFDNSGRASSEVSSDINVTIDNTPPTLNSAYTLDEDHNGYIDTIQLTFDENIDDNKLGRGADGWSADGYTVNSVTSVQGGLPNDSDNVLYLNLVENTYDTGATPNILYTSPATSTHDLAGNELVMISPLVSQDYAEPVIISVETQDTDSDKLLDALKVKFSEPIDGSRLEGSEEINHWSIEGYDLASVDWGDVEDDDIIFLRLTPEKTENDTGTIPPVSYRHDLIFNSVHDLSFQDNELIEGTWGSSDKASPQVSWVNPTKDAIISGTINVEVTALDNDLTGIQDVKFEYKRNIDGAEWQEIVTDSESPYATDWNTTGLPLDTYTLRVTVNDNAENATIIERAVSVAAVVSGESGVGASTESAVVTWTTDRPTSSRVVYDTVSHSGLGEAPNYGYAWSTGTSDTDSKVLSHSITIGGLSAGTIYYYRTISAGSPTAISNQNTLATLSIAGAPAPGPWSGLVAGISTVANVPWTTSVYSAEFPESTEVTTTEEVNAEENEQVLGEETQVKETKKTWIWIITIALISFIGFIYLRKRSKKS